MWPATQQGNSPRAPLASSCGRAASLHEDRIITGLGAADAKVSGEVVALMRLILPTI